MNQNAFGLFNCLFNEVEYGVTCLIFCIQNNLIVLIEPVERKVRNSNWLPVIHNLFASAIYYVGDLVSDDELDVLGC